MALDLTKFICWSTTYVGGTPGCTMEEGIMPSERSLDDTLYHDLDSGTFTLTLPIPTSTVISSGTKFFISVRAQKADVDPTELKAELFIDGVSRGSIYSGLISDLVTKTWTLTCDSAQTVSASVTIKFSNSGTYPGPCPHLLLS